MGAGTNRDGYLSGPWKGYDPAPGRKGISERLAIKKQGPVLGIWPWVVWKTGS